MLIKILYSSFQNTDLDYQLHQREITNVVVAGLESNTCFEATSRYAYELYVLPYINIDTC
jgi:nicotinamidase-related amidase